MKSILAIAAAVCTLTTGVAAEQDIALGRTLQRKNKGKREGIIFKVDAVETGEEGKIVFYQSADGEDVHISV